MSKHAKLLEKILSGAADANIPFDGLCLLLQRLGFMKQTNGFVIHSELVLQF
jgi:hypothetical protein